MRRRNSIMQSTDSLTFPPSLYSDFAWSVRTTPFHSWLPTRFASQARSADEITYIHCCSIKLSTRLRSARAHQPNTLLSCQATALQKTLLAGIRYIATTLSELLKSSEDLSMKNWACSRLHSNQDSPRRTNTLLLRLGEYSLAKRARAPLGTFIAILSGSHNAARRISLHTYIALQKTLVARIRYIPTSLSGPQVLALFHQTQSQCSADEELGLHRNQDARLPFGGENTFMVRVYLGPCLVSKNHFA